MTMKITHNILHKKISKEISRESLLKKNISLFLINKKGSYLFLPSDPLFSLSNFQGWFNLVEEKEVRHTKETKQTEHTEPENNEEFLNYSMYKTIENIYIDKAPAEIANNFVNVERISEKSKERFTLLKEVLVYEIENYSGFVNIDLDFRNMFDFDDRGRIYKIHKENQDSNNIDAKFNDVITIEYTKFIDNALKTVQKTNYLVIKGISDAYEFLNRWEKRNYSYDSSRNSRSEFYIFKAIKFYCKNNARLIFSFSDNKEKALEKITKVIENMKKVEDSHKEFILNVLKTKEKIFAVSDEKIAFAYANCINAMKGLNVDLDVGSKKTIGLWAGLPWFYHFWSRDELISNKSLMLEGKYTHAREIVLRYLNQIRMDGRLANRFPPSDLDNADSIGWLFKRIHDFIVLLEEKNEEFDNIFNLYNLKYIRERLQFSIKKMLKIHYKEGLIKNNSLTTWMDTQFVDGSYQTDFREGYRIEIQCLFLSMLKFMNLLNVLLANKFIKHSDKLINITQNEFDYRKLERELRDSVRNKFLVNVDGKNMLNDGYNCPHHDVCRPNVFLAHYLYSDLLNSKEWEDVFDNALSKLWCEWKLDDGKVCGGLSTIDKSHWMYQPHHTGENNRSYHRGDSWFFINNFAAISMHKLNKTKYKQYVDKITHASAEDILFDGFVGYASEISSASELSSVGCFCQTWSIATFIELIHELYIE